MTDSNYTFYSFNKLLLKVLTMTRFILLIVGKIHIDEQTFLK
jgi:hypothetical protein